MIEPDAGPPAADVQIAGMIFAVLLLDEAGTIQSANPAAEEMLERSATRLIGRKFIDTFEIADDRVREQFQFGELRLIARSLSLAGPNFAKLINLTSSPLPSTPGWRIVTLSDVGDTGVLQEQDEIVSGAPSILAHEIKNPLAAIRGASQLLARRVTVRDRPMAQMIGREVDRIAALVDRMQLLGSQAALTIGSCNLHEIVRTATSTLAAARNGDVNFIEEFDPSLPQVQVDRGAMEQVLINLLSNACDATAHLDPPEVLIRTRYASGLVYSSLRLGRATRLPIEVSVIDRGSGIAPELRDHVFEPFVTAKKNGQGLGLALVRKLVRDMGGRIVHHRDEKAGTTHFRINLAATPGTNG